MSPPKNRCTSAPIFRIDINDTYPTDATKYINTLDYIFNNIENQSQQENKENKEISHKDYHYLKQEDSSITLINVIGYQCVCLFQYIINNQIKNQDQNTKKLINQYGDEISNKISISSRDSEYISQMMHSYLGCKQNMQTFTNLQKYILLQTSDREDKYTDCYNPNPIYLLSLVDFNIVDTIKHDIDHVFFCEIVNGMHCSNTSNESTPITFFINETNHHINLYDKLYNYRCSDRNKFKTVEYLFDYCIKHLNNDKDKDNIDKVLFYMWYYIHVDTNLVKLEPKKEINLQDIGKLIYKKCGGVMSKLPSGLDANGITDYFKDCIQIYNKFINWTEDSIHEIDNGIPLNYNNNNNTFLPYSSDGGKRKIITRKYLKHKTFRFHKNKSHKTRKNRSKKTKIYSVR